MSLIAWDSLAQRRAWERLAAHTGLGADKDGGIWGCLSERNAVQSALWYIAVRSQNLHSRLISPFHILNAPSQLEFLSGPISCVHPSNFWLIMQHHSLVRKLLLTVFHNLRRKGRCSRSAPPALYTSPLSYLLIQDLVWQEALGLSAATAQSNSVLTAGRGCTIIWSFATWDDNATTCWMLFSMLNKVITTQLNHSGLREITVLPNLLQRTFSC